MMTETPPVSNLPLTDELTTDQFFEVCSQLNFNAEERQDFLKMLGVGLRSKEQNPTEA